MSGRLRLNIGRDSLKTAQKSLGNYARSLRAEKFIYKFFGEIEQSLGTMGIPLRTGA